MQHHHDQHRIDREVLCGDRGTSCRFLHGVIEWRQWSENNIRSPSGIVSRRAF